MRPLLALALFLAAVTPVFAQDEGSPKAQVLTESFLAAHPDVKYRMEGLTALDQGQPERAYLAFRRASTFADKASQAMVGDMLWTGNGTAEDRVLAYVWMDLAAERGYTMFISKREKYWAQLNSEQQARAKLEGLAVYDEFGDAAAKPRLERKLDRARRKITGSRTGFVGALKIMIPGPGGWTTINGDTYYADHYWKPKDYFAWQDKVWSAPPTGVVDIGPMSTEAGTSESNDEPTQDGSD